VDLDVSRCALIVHYKFDSRDSKQFSASVIFGMRIDAVQEQHPAHLGGFRGQLPSLRK
jgi:hypothetical protein